MIIALQLWIMIHSSRIYATSYTRPNRSILKLNFRHLFVTALFQNNLYQLKAFFINSPLRISVTQVILKNMASQSQGIQQLLVAEKRAAEKVSEARKRKARRIKQAREQAAAEIENYRKERERQFKEYEAKHMGSKEDAIAKIEKGTESHLKELDESVERNKELLILDMISLATDVKPEVHRNYFIMKSFNKV